MNINSFINTKKFIKSLKNFSKKKIIGVEPCKNLEKITQKKGFKVYPEYWDVKLSKKITSKKKIDLIYSANTLSHIKNFSQIFCVRPTPLSSAFSAFTITKSIFLSFF